MLLIQLLLLVAPPAAQEPGLLARDIPDLIERWPRQYVRWIMTEEEKEYYRELETSEQKLLFIEQFWKRRDPTPETDVNEYRLEYMERYAYVYKAFAAGKPGWATDRGRIYLLLGPPHGVMRNPMGRWSLERPSEIWTYNGLNIPGLPASIDINFVDFKGTGEYEIVSDLDTAAPLLNQFGFPESGLLAIAMRRGRIGMEDPRTGLGQFRDVDSTRLIMREFDLQRQLLQIQNPEHTLRPLDEVVNVRVQFDSIQLKTVKGQVYDSSGAARVPISVAVPYRQLGFRRMDERVIYDVEYLIKVVDVPGNLKDLKQDRLTIALNREQQSQAQAQQLVIEEMLTVRPGNYKLQTFIRDNNHNRVGNLYEPLQVPRRPSRGLSLSSVFLTTSLVRTEEVEASPYQFGSIRVVPSLDGRFYSDRELGVYVQAYGSRSGADGKSSLRVDFFLMRDGRLYLGVPSTELQPDADPVAITASIPLRKCTPGDYVLRVRVTDEATGRRAEQDAAFTVLEPPAS